MNMHGTKTAAHVYCGVSSRNNEEVGVRVTLITCVWKSRWWSATAALSRDAWVQAEVPLSSDRQGSQSELTELQSLIIRFQQTGVKIEPACASI